MKEISIDVQSNAKSTRDLTAEEIEQIVITSEIEKLINDNAVSQLAAKADAQAKLAALGLTADDLKALGL